MSSRKQVAKFHTKTLKFLILGKRKNRVSVSLSAENILLHIKQIHTGHQVLFLKYKCAVLGKQT